MRCQYSAVVASVCCSVHPELCQAVVRQALAFSKDIEQECDAGGTLFWREQFVCCCTAVLPSATPPAKARDRLKPGQRCNRLSVRTPLVLKHSVCSATLHSSNAAYHSPCQMKMKAVAIAEPSPVSQGQTDACKEAPAPLRGGHSLLLPPPRCTQRGCQVPLPAGQPRGRSFVSVGCSFVLGFNPHDCHARATAAVHFLSSAPSS